MAQLFKMIGIEWSIISLTEDALSIAGTDPFLPPGVVLRRAGTEAAGWMLLAPPDVSPRVNGVPVQLGIRALRDRDEIQLPGLPPTFFSTEKLVSVEPYTGPVGGQCPRCTKAIDTGSAAVRCGACGTWYHQSEARACFTYGESPICVSCAHDAVVSGEFSWTPEEV
jgi:hypothetical protein